MREEIEWMGEELGGSEVSKSGGGDHERMFQVKRKYF